MVQSYREKLNDYGKQVYTDRISQIASSISSEACEYENRAKPCSELQISNSEFKNFNSMKENILKAVVVDQSVGLAAQGMILNL